MGIALKSKTKATEALKLLNHINSYRFEQEYGELKGYKEANEALEKAAKALCKIIENS